LGKTISNSEHVAMVRWLIVACMAKLKINVAQRKCILEFAIILGRDKQWQQHQWTTRLVTFEY